MKKTALTILALLVAVLTSAQLVSVPDGVELKGYAMKASSKVEGKKSDVNIAAKVGFLGDVVYMQGICSTAPEAWLKGHLDGDKVTLDAGQPMGTYETWGVEYDILLTNGATFDYDAATGVLTSEGYTVKYDDGTTLESLSDVRMEPTVLTAKQPAKPKIISFYTDYGEHWLAFEAPTEDVDGLPLKAQNLYFRVYYDIEGTVGQFVFTTNDYRISGNTTDMPLTISDEDCYTVDGLTKLGIYDSAAGKWNRVGVQSVNKVNGEVAESDIVWAKIKDYDDQKLPTPAAPAITAFANAAYGYYAQFDMPTTDTEGKELNTDNLYFRVYYDIDGTTSQITFTSEYDPIEEDTKDVPYAIFDEDGEDIYMMSGAGFVYFYEGNEDEWTRVGIQSVYKEDGREQATDIRWFTIKENTDPKDPEGPTDTGLVIDPTKLLELPEGVETTNYLMTGRPGTGASAKQQTIFAKVGFQDDIVYIQGISFKYSTGWVVGKLADGKVTVPAGQFVGEYTYWTGELLKVYLHNDIVFDYDATTGVLTAEDIYYLYDSDGDQDETLVDVVLTPEGADAELPVPADPQVANFWLDEWYGQHVATLDIPTVDTNDLPLKADQLFFRIYTETEGVAEPFLFTSDDYEDIVDDETYELPYDVNGDDIYQTGDLIWVYFYDFNAPNWNRIGVQTVYKVGDEQTESNIAWYRIKDDAATGIATTQNSELTTKQRYDLQGRRVAKGQRGLLIEQLQDADGTVKTIKVVK